MIIVVKPLKRTLDIISAKRREIERLSELINGLIGDAHKMRQNSNWDNLECRAVSISDEFLIEHYRVKLKGLREDLRESFELTKYSGDRDYPFMEMLWGKEIMKK